MANLISDEILQLLIEGKNSNEIISMGYKKGTVYSTQRKWRQGKIKTPPDVESIATPSNTPRARASQPTNAPLEIESDPEIVQLKKEIRIAELQKQLDRAQAPSEIEILIAAAYKIGCQRHEECVCEDNGLCMVWEWSSKDEVPKDIGELVLEGKDTWRMKPSPLYCAMCVASLEGAVEKLDDGLAEIPLANIRERFSCECGTEGMVAVSIKCTACGRDTWWGQWPKKE